MFASKKKAFNWDPEKHKLLLGDVPRERKERDSSELLSRTQSQISHMPAARLVYIYKHIRMLQSWPGVTRDSDSV